MKNVLYLTFLVFAFVSYAAAQSKPPPSFTPVSNVGTAAARTAKYPTCNPDGSSKTRLVWWQTDAAGDGVGLYICSAVNTWTKSGGSSPASLPQGTVNLSSYASLSAAVAAIGSSAKTDLIISSDTTVASNTTVTKNISLKLQGTAIITINTGITLSIENGADLSAPIRQIFAGAGNVSWTGSMPITAYPEWWGAVGDGVTDDLAAFDKMIASCPGVGFAQKSLHVVVSNGKTYQFSNTWEIDNPVLVEGQGGDNWANTAILQFAANKTGIIVHHLGTKDGNPTSRQALFSQFRQFYLNGVAGGTTHTVTINGLTVTRTAGANFTQLLGYILGNTITINGYEYTINTLTDANTVQIRKPRLYVIAKHGTTEVLNGDYSAWPLTGEWNGQNISIAGTNYQISNITFSGGQYRIVLSAPYFGPVTGTYVGLPVTFTAGSSAADTMTATAHGLLTGTAFYIVSTTGAVPGGITTGRFYYAVVVDVNTIKVADTYADAIAGTPIVIDLLTNGSGTHSALTGTFDGSIELQTVANTAGLAARPNLYHGIDLRAAAAVEKMRIWNFAGNGIDVDTTKGLGILGTTPNANNARLSRNSLYYNYGSGIHATGLNSNQMYIDNNDASANRGAGLFEASFLGNNYWGNHTSYNYFGAILAVGATNNSQFFGEYTEGGQPSMFTDQHVMVFSGIHGAGFDSQSIGGYLRHASSTTELGNLTVQNNTGKVVGARLSTTVTGGQPNTMLAFGSAEDVNNLTGGGTATAVRQFAYQLGYDQLATGWYNLYYGGNYASHQSQGVIAMSGKLAAEGGGKLWLPQGFYAGQGGTRRRWQLVSAIPTSGTVALGDIFWNNATGSNGPVGWIVTTAGTVGSGAVLTQIGSDSSTATLTNKTLTSPAINTPTGIVKGDVGLGSVDNTSDATKNSATATLTNKTITNPAITNQTLTDGVTINWDGNSGGSASVTLGGNRTMAAPTNLKIGGSYTLRVIQDATGSRTITWNAVFKWPSATAPTLSTVAARVDLITCISFDGTNLLCNALIDVR